MSALSGGLFSESRETTEARTEKHDDPSLNTPVEAEKTATISPLSVVLANETLRNLTTVTVGNCVAQLDAPLGRLLLVLAQSLVIQLGAGKQSSPSTASSPQDSSPPWRINIGKITLRLLEQLMGISVTFKERLSPGSMTPPVDDSYQPTSRVEILLQANVTKLELERSAHGAEVGTSVSAGKITLGYAAEDYIISFDASLKMRESIRDVRMVPDQDIFLLVRQSTFLTKINLTTLPIHMNLDLQRLDDTLAWFGGFSSILGLGSSIASIATVTAPAPAPTSSPGQKRAVRFDIPPAESRPPPVSRAQTKMDARIGGVILDVHGKECSVRLDTTAVKTVVRQEVIGAQVDRLKLSGPHTRHEINEASIVFDHTNLRMEYLSVPTEADLGRLLCLLSPSHDNYATDDDILVETLMRQRKQGSVLRISLEKVSGRIEGSSHFSRLATLSGEIAKLSTVAKYLPDDERAGILTLGLVRTVEVEANVHAGLGRLSLQSRNVEICHVGLPFLLATSVQSMRLCRGTEEELLAEVSATELGNTIPMIMARMIGDELEPTLKAKLRGVRVEYRVPIVMALSDMTGATTSEEAFAGLAKSVIGLGDLEQPSVLSRGNQASADERYPPQCKYLQVDIIFRDCILGLNPLGMPCKGLVVLTDTHFTGGLGDSSLMRMTVDVRKSSLLLIDDVGRIPHATSQGPNPRGEPTGTEGDLVADLCTNGFVSIAYISSAKISMRELASPRDGKRSIDLQLNDNVLVLESCADSTQTLLSLFGALAPPRPPSKEIKYRTEVISVRDMLASLSGDAFTPVDRNADSEDDYFMSEDDATLPGELDQSYLSVEDDEPGRRFVSRPLQSLDNLADEQQASSGNELRFEDDYFESKGRGHGGAPKWDSIQNRYGVADDLYILGSPLKIRIRDVHVMWNLFDGYDWPKTRDAISHAVEDVSLKARERQLRQEQAASREDDESAIGDFLFNSIYIGIPANRDPKDLVSRINHDVDDGASEPESTAPSTMSRTPSHQPRAGRGRGKKVRLGRSKHHKMAFEIRGITTDLIVFPPGSGETQSSLDIRVRDFEIYDHVPTSTWKKFLTYMHDAGAREIGSDMVHLEILNVQPIPDLAASEMVLKVTLLPLRLHVDQDALDFLTRFFEFKDDQQPVPASAADVPFLQRVEVSAVRVQLDYKPKKIDYAGLRSGHTTEFMNLFILDQADMVLRHVIIYGVSGFDKLSRTLNDIWMPDIKTTQLPGVLAGLAPVRSIVNVGGGLRGLVVVPLQEYRRDGRLVRGLQKGAVAFARTTTSELVKLGTKVAIRTQTALQGAEEFLNRPGRGGGRGRGSAGFGDPADDYGHDGRDDDDDDDDDNDNEGEAKKTISLYANPPIGVMQGLRGALGSLERDLLTARDAIVAMPGEMLDSGSAHGAAQAVLHRAPTIILRPAIGASKAISQTLMGATHALDPHHQRRVDEKYKRS
ncbi:MAG: autophagy- protein 2 [Phylliscum demangeonii]|nr:MAG: autophagy- protein 2 [Phylliscum demangeonii]